MARLAGSLPCISFAQEQAPAVTSWGYVRLAGTAIDLKLGSTDSLNFAFRTKFALGDGYKPGDAPILNGLETRRGSLWAGPAVVWNADFAKLSFEVLADALRKSKGIEGKLGIERNLRAGPIVFTPHAAVDFVDKKYVDYSANFRHRRATGLDSAGDGAAPASARRPPATVVDTARDWTTSTSTYCTGAGSIALGETVEAMQGSSQEAPPCPLDAAILFAPVGDLVPLALRKAAAWSAAGST